MPQKRSPLKNLGSYAGVKKSRSTYKQVSKVLENASQHPHPLNTPAFPTPAPPAGSTATTADTSAPDLGTQTVQPLSYASLGLREDVAGSIGGGSTCDMDGTDDEKYGPAGVFKFPPSLESARVAHADLALILRPPRATGRGYKDSGLDEITRTRLEGIQMFLGHYVRQEELRIKSGRLIQGNWTTASLETARIRNTTPHYARKLREWAHAYLDHRELPDNNYGSRNRSLIDDEDLAHEIQLHLQSVGKYIKAEDIVHFLDTPEMLARMQRKKTISIATAQRWLKKMGHRWKRDHKGQYVDGHERADVVAYRNTQFLPAMAEIEKKTRKWVDRDEDAIVLAPNTRPNVVWYHDESTFYAHDRRKSQWVHKDATPLPYPKGEGHSLMVADFVSADYGWLRSPDGEESARVIFRAGKARDGWFTNEWIIAQVERAIKILRKYYPNEDHIFVFDNATTHTKRTEGALSALKMPKGPSDSFGVEVNIIGDDGRPMHSTDGKYMKKKIRMSNGTFGNGLEQEFYFPDDHPEHAGKFKGMEIILQERGIDTRGKKAQCGKSFSDCPEGATRCCCRRTLYNEPDFSGVESVLETTCKAHGFQILFLPKFHCELNFIEQCWGSAKRYYRLLPPSSKEEDLHRNVLESINQVSLTQMRRFAARSSRFMDAYRKGLNGKQAAWVTKRYRGHRVLSEEILRELDEAGMV